MPEGGENEQYVLEPLSASMLTGACGLYFTLRVIAAAACDAAENTLLKTRCGRRYIATGSFVPPPEEEAIAVGSFEHVCAGFAADASDASVRGMPVNQTSPFPMFVAHVGTDNVNGAMHIFGIDTK